VANTASEIVDQAPPNALYVHIPFCAGKCRYCDFVSEPVSRSKVVPYMAALLEELNVRAGCAGTLNSVYIGGGTPSLLRADQIDEIMAAVRSAYRVAADVEVSLEVNPGDCVAAEAAGWRAAGVNRVSLGAQSFDPGVLEFLGRRHGVRDIAAAAGTLRGAGFANLNMDLIYSVPVQDLTSWRMTIETALDFVPEHISAYSLTYEPGTPLHSDVSSDRIRPLDEDTELGMYREAISVFDAAGLCQYEISNFARSGYRCKHNVVYWHNEPYIGVGAGAVSYIDGVRAANCSDVGRYTRMINGHRSAVVSRERTDPALAMAETCIQQLRLVDGIDRAGFTDRFGHDVADVYSLVIDEMGDAGLIDVTATYVRLTAKGREVADEIAQSFLP